MVLQPPVESSQFTFWEFKEKVRSLGLVPAFGLVGDALDEPMMELLLSLMQNNLLDCGRWTTHVELPNAIIDYIKVPYSRRRRYSEHR